MESRVIIWHQQTRTLLEKHTSFPTSFTLLNKIRLWCLYLDIRSAFSSINSHSSCCLWSFLHSTRRTAWRPRHCRVASLLPTLPCTSHPCEIHTRGKWWQRISLYKQKVLSCFTHKKKIQSLKSPKRPLPGDVIIHSISCLLVMDPVADENAGGLLPQLPRAQHAITVSLPVAETAFIHLAAGVPERIITFLRPLLRQKRWWWSEYSSHSLSV